MRRVEIRFAKESLKVSTSPPVGEGVLIASPSLLQMGRDRCNECVTVTPLDCSE